MSVMQLTALPNAAPPVLSRFVAKTRRASNGCWLWTGHVQPHGYAQFWLGGAARWAHRVAYELFAGDIPEGFHIDHVCFRRRCVNPEHLRAIPAPENCRRHKPRRAHR